MLSPAVPGALSFEVWFNIPPSEKSARLARLSTVSRNSRAEPAHIPNYEAQQAPLAYIMLAPFDAALAHVRLRTRVLILRLIGTISSILLLWFGLLKVCQLLEVSNAFALAAAACIFSSQMLWATIAHTLVCCLARNSR
jgi:hypothetical protein